jgi:uncharacterized membrane protein YfhO
VEKANFLFQAVYATKGQHIIEFSYKPESFFWGQAVTAVSILIVIPGLVISRRRSSRFN